MKRGLLPSSNGYAPVSLSTGKSSAREPDKLVDSRISSSVRIRNFVKWLLFPGLDLLTRCRYRFLPTFFAAGPLLTLDAGCGNGALSYAAYRLGNTVLGITANEREVRRNRQLFACRGIDTSDLAFVKLNLYDLPQLQTTFDQIICSETLEHVADDELVLRHFNTHLKIGGVLHLCSPYALHPLNNLGRLHEPEDGRHVRDGYTPDAYERLLDAAGFEIIASAGIGGPIAVTLDRWIGLLRTRFGDAVALPLFVLVLPLSWFDRLDPQIPFSVYVKAVKRRELIHDQSGLDF